MHKRIKYGDPRCTNATKYREAKEVQSWLEREELLWCQQSRVLWLKESDQNTNIFHSKASQCKRKNAITQIKDSKGYWQENEARKQVILSHFIALFSQQSDIKSVEFLGTLRGRTMEEIRIDLSRAYKEEELKDAFHQIHPLKALGPDDMTPIFF